MHCATSLSHGQGFDAIKLIREVIAHRYWLRPTPEITDDTVLSDIADSLDCVSIVMGVEEALHREVPGEIVTRWVTVGDVQRFMGREKSDA